MGYIEERRQEKKQIQQRYDLAMMCIRSILTEEGMAVKELSFYEYFIHVAGFLMSMDATLEIVESEKLKEMSLEALEQLNYGNYSFIEGIDGKFTYETSYLNPAYAVEKLGVTYGAVLSFLFAELQGVIPFAYERDYFNITILLELFIKIYHCFEEETKETYGKIKEIISYHFQDYLEMAMDQRVREQFDPSFCVAVDIINNANLSDIRYLYQFGEMITENEQKTAEYMNSLSEEAIEKMAETYTEGFRMGFINARIDLNKKSIVNIRYCLGFERMVKAAMKQFDKMGLKTTIYRTAISRTHKNQNLKTGYYSAGFHKQYEYDHRFDDAIYLDETFTDRKLVCYRMALEKYKRLVSQYSGPAVIEIFGEEPFEPISKSECTHLSEKQEKLVLGYQRKASLLVDKFMKRKETSFTIIAYPIPDIGMQFKEIFDATVLVNTLDMELYKNIQQSIIDALDQGIFVRVKGCGKNKTDLKIMLHPLADQSKETNFENCLADVNIPVGEVFTSPKLTGTEGILHVSEVYLNALKYRELYLHFTDGKIDDYNCSNFSEEEKNKSFIKENLMYQHPTLPIGEFAIGTNTTAYKMGKKFGIQDRLPILIAEKTGPHFAIGDTCYSMSEENHVYNPDGKEIVAKDNECSILRKEDMSKAYFNCHTDITIPYDELGDITVYCGDEKEITIIKNGRFVLSGTEALNEALS